MKNKKEKKCAPCHNLPGPGGAPPGANEKTSPLTGNRRIIITGPLQSGKSTLAWHLVQELKTRRRSLAGFIALGLWKENQRWGFDLFDLGKGTTTPLARQRPDTGSGGSGSRFGAPRIPYTFFEQGKAAGMKALHPDRCQGADIILIDELGKLEIKHQGWATCLPALLPLTKPVHIWIVRETLIKEICQMWPFRRTQVVHVHEPHALEKLICHAIQKEV